MARDRAADRASGEGDPGPGGIRRDQIWPRRHGALPSVRVRLLAMRIIAGEFRGRRLAAPKGLGTRPMLDRVREAIFSTLTPWFGDPVVLDLFAGSGRAERAHGARLALVFVTVDSPLDIGR